MPPGSYVATLGFGRLRARLNGPRVYSLNNNRNSEMKELEGVKSFLLVDEVKHSIINDGEDAFYYFAVSLPIHLKTSIEEDLSNLTSGMTKGFHAKNVYKASGIDYRLLNGMTDLITRYSLPCICFRYDKKLFYDSTVKYLKINDHPEISKRLTNWEFQAFFYFIQALNLHLAKGLSKIDLPVFAFFDRGIYGMVDKIEAVDVDSLFLGRAIFTSTSKNKLLALADHFGFVFAKVKKTLANIDIPILAGDPFGVQLLKLTDKKLFTFLQAEDWIRSLPGFQE